MKNQKLTRQQAINANCKQCLYDQYDTGTWREQIENCTSELTCPLWHFRPVTTKTNNELKEERKAQMTPEQLESYQRKQEATADRFKK